jgi:hypothetical protein
LKPDLRAAILNLCLPTRSASWEVRDEAMGIDEARR